MRTPPPQRRRLLVGLLLAVVSTLPGRANSTVSPNNGGAENPPAIYARALVARSEAAAALAAGDPDTAIARCREALQLPGSAATACRLLTAAAHLERHAWAPARQVIEPARGSFGPLEPWASLFLGEALAGLGEDEQALRLLDEAAAADPDGPLGRRAEVPAALALAHGGKLDEARRRIDRLLAASRGNAAQLRLALAMSLQAAGDTAGAVALYGRLWREAPDTPEAERATERLEALRAAGATVPAPTPAERIERIDRWLARGHAQRALDELAGLQAPGREAELALLRARALSAAERKPEAEGALAPALADAAPRAVQLQARELAARLAMRRGAVDEALPHLRQIERDDKGRAGREASFLAAFFLYDAGRFEEAVAAFRRYAAQHRGAPRADDAEWFAAWSLYQQGRHREAAAALEALAKNHPRSSLVDQAIYWQGRALERAGHAAVAHRHYRAAIARDPTGWYALLARERLGEAAPPLDRVPGRVAVPAQLAKQPQQVARRMERATALYAVGLVDEAGAELDAALAGRRDGPLAAAAAELAREAGDWHRAFQLGLFRLGGFRGAADLGWPQAWKTEVEGAANRHGVDPHFVWSIMRQESGFRPRVRSAAAAVGLMQVLPVTAERIATLRGQPVEEALRLDDPRVNIELGTWYLGALLERFGGSIPLAAAAYNGGPPAVARWLAEPARKELPLDEFVESIPYRETRGYVKKVVGNLVAYRLVHGGEPPRFGEGLPAVRDGVDF